MYTWRGLTHHTLTLLNPSNVWCQKCDQLIIKMQEKWEDYKCMILLDHTYVKEFYCVPWMQDFCLSVPHDMHGKLIILHVYVTVLLVSVSCCCLVTGCWLCREAMEIYNYSQSENSWSMRMKLLIYYSGCWISEIEAYAINSRFSNNWKI